VSDLQNSLNLLYEYCLKWGLKVNTTKQKQWCLENEETSRMMKHGCKAYNNNELEVILINKKRYLITMYTGSFVLNQETLADKGLISHNVLLNNKLMKGKALRKHSLHEKNSSPGFIEAVQTKQYNFKPSVLCKLF